MNRNEIYEELEAEIKDVFPEHTKFAPKRPFRENAEVEAVEIYWETDPSRKNIEVIVMELSRELFEDYPKGPHDKKQNLKKVVQDNYNNSKKKFCLTSNDMN